MDEPTKLDNSIRFGPRLGYASRQWRRAVDERLQPFGLTEATWLPLLHIARNEPLRQKDLAEVVGIECSTLVRLIDALDNGGLIKRVPDGDDRRAKLLSLTPSGRLLVGKVEAAAAVIRRQIFAGISEEELAIALNVIERICDGLNRTWTQDPEDAV
ncbi:winged helix DNA-binding protein [Oryzomonas japonica]|uniref:Winged helix DNA-binding protein n=1 Tax=Oryzomonas japonica TaxID=2603858 RepID=A0A7J4ZM86_9BACT|nr:MarR family transcriptional regulator [Oryzomonas japonica]KAB0663439.1 winged helix DNA-binding protein [Oryzomonas japonica]